MVGKFPQANPCLNFEACKILNLTTHCVNGHKGFICADCIKGYHIKGHRCTICPGKRETIIYSSVTAVVSILLILLVITLAVMKSNKDQLNRFLSNTKICLNYFYFSSKMYDILTFIDWPNGMLNFINALKWIELNPVSLLSITCWLPKITLYHSYIFFVSVNGCILLVTITCACVWKLGHFLGVISKEKMKNQRKSLLAITSVTLFFLYPATSVAIIQLLPYACKEYSLSFPDKMKVFYFMRDPGAACFTAEHKKFLTVVHISLIYVFGVPVGIPFVVWYLRRKLAREAKVCLVEEEEKKQEFFQSDIPTRHFSDVQENANVNYSVQKKVSEDICTVGTHDVKDKAHGNLSTSHIPAIKDKGHERKEKGHENLDTDHTSNVEEKVNDNPHTGRAPKIEDKVYENQSVGEIPTIKNKDYNSQDKSHENLQTDNISNPREKVGDIPYAGHIPDVEDKVGENLSIAEDVYDGLGFFYGNYKEQYFFWESLEMIKKMFVATSGVFIGENSYTSLALLIMFSGVFAVLHAHFKPIANNKEHFLQLVCLSALHIQLLLGLSMNIKEEVVQSDYKQDIEALTVSLIICNVTVAVLILGK